jgi:8-oxo-dGTP pyrophosphatase MutT (NUDIX family)
MMFDADGRLLLIRNSYGSSNLFVLPGGGIRPFEDPRAAARREVKEELGLEIDRLVLRSLHSSSAEGKRDEIHLFEAHAKGPPRIDGVELLEARFASLADLPVTTSPATCRRIDEFLGRRDPDGSW